MKPSINKTLSILLCGLLFSAAVKAQSAGGKATLVRPGQPAVTEGSRGTLARRPAALAAGSVILPKEYRAAQQRNPVWPAPRPVSEAEKKRVLLEQLNKYKTMAGAYHSGLNPDQ